MFLPFVLWLFQNTASNFRQLPWNLELKPYTQADMHNGVGKAVTASCVASIAENGISDRNSLPAVYLLIQNKTQGSGVYQLGPGNRRARVGWGLETRIQRWNFRDTI